MTPTAELRRLLAEAKAEGGRGEIEPRYPAFNAYVEAGLIALPALLDRLEEQEKTLEIYRMLIGPLLDRLEEQEKTLEICRMRFGPLLADGTLT